MHEDGTSNPLKSTEEWGGGGKRETDGVSLTNVQYMHVKTTQCNPFVQLIYTNLKTIHNN
jgi:hypothetical protein